MKKEITNYKPWIFSSVFLLIISLSVILLRNWPRFTDYYYPWFYRAFYPLYTQLFGWIPFSVGDVFYIILGLLLIWTIILGIRCFVLGQKWRGIRIFSRFIVWIGIFYFMFHLLWAFNYYKPSLVEVWQIEKYNTNDLKVVSNELFSKCLEQRNVAKEDKNGVFTFNRKQFYAEFPTQIKLDFDVNLPYHHIPKNSQKKYSIFSFLMRYFGVAGYFNPFTAEAQITRKMPDSTIPFSMAHEQAHQMGYATENEANFIGYITCIQSNDNDIQYAANYKALKYVLSELYPLDSTFVIQKLDSFSPAMKRDYEEEKAYHQKYDGAADKAFSTMNNLYLQANNQAEGIQSYNRFVELLVGFYKLNGKLDEEE